jgi:hypothetical protein
MKTKITTKHLDKVGALFIDFVNENHELLLNCYNSVEGLNEQMTFPTFCYIQFCDSMTKSKDAK